jgi:superfamily II DNA or RNA helicase
MADAISKVPEIRTIILVPTIALLDQWIVGLEEDLGIPVSRIGSFSGESKITSGRQVNVIVINSARTRINAIAEGAETFLIVDECHRAASGANSQALLGQHRMTLGLSATPERQYDELFETVIVPALGPVIYKYDYSRALSDGVISPFQLVNLRISLSESEAAEYQKFTKRLAPLLRRREIGEMVDEQIQRLLIARARVSTRAKNRLPSTVRIIDRHRRERAIVFHEEIEAAEIITATLKQRGHRVAAYHSGLGQSLRQDNLRMFRRGEIDVLVTCRALDEGIDIPNASLAVIAASTSSTRQRIQRLGRVLRPALGKEMATVYTIYATDLESDRLRKEAENLQGVDRVKWLKVGSS